MKIVIDTENFTTPFKKLNNSMKETSKLVWKNSDAGHVALFGVSLVLCGYIISCEIDNYLNRNSNRGTVDVTLEKPDTEEYKLNVKQPKTKYSQLYNTGKKISLSNKEFDCLAKNIYWETSFEPLLGQMAVANVTYNRVLSGKWGDTFCDVVYAPKQFSWTNHKKLRNANPKNKAQWERAKHSANLFTKGVRVTTLDKSQFYFAQYIKAPKWSKSMSKQAHIGQHIFFAQNGD
jgi:spore germination cell wall hydrolase CwlJ-like protein